MGLLSNPLTVNDGTGASPIGDRTFSFRSQRPDNRSVVGDYIEDAAATAASSLITAKHDLRTTAVNRALVQRTYKLAPAAGDGTLYQITQNYTIVASPLFTVAELTPEFTLFCAVLAESGLLAGLRAKKI
jgi:hypothetical protein